MHDTARENAKRFFDAYVPAHGEVSILDIGSRNVNGSLRGLAPPSAKYIGVDIEDGWGVDIVLADPYIFPFEDCTFDLAVSSSCFEHAQMFWLTFLEALRVLKPGGHFYLNAPSNGPVHRHPVDCWRFYPDAAQALVAWAARCGRPARVLESSIAPRAADVWEDFVAVFVKER